MVAPAFARSLAVSFPDLIQPELGAYHSSVEMPGDFSDFWEATIAEARAIGGDVSIVKADTTLRAVDADRKR